MTIRTVLEPIQCKLIRICLELDNGMLVRSDAEIDIFNAEGVKLIRHTISIPWTTGEQTVIENVVSSKYAIFKTVNDFTEYGGE